VKHPAVLAALSAIVILFALSSQRQVAAGGAVTRDQVAAWIHHYAAAEGVPAGWLLAVATCESQLEPYAVGRSGEVGPFQWHPRGVWSQVPVFRSWWDVYDVRLNVWGAAWAFARGLAFHWSCA
jgi:hypothetical protein